MSIFYAIWCALIDFVNALSENVIQKIIDSIAWVIQLLPKTPFEIPVVPWGDFGRSIGYFIPVGTFVQHFALMLVLLAVWYTVEYAMRWIKMIK